jgi:hypothetical protein
MRSFSHRDKRRFAFENAEQIIKRRKKQNRARGGIAIPIAAKMM